MTTYKTAFHLHIKHPDDFPEYKREKFLDSASLDKLIKEAVMTKIDILGITPMYDIFHPDFYECSELKEMVDCGKIKKLNNSIFKHKSGVYLIRGMEWHEPQGHIGLLGIDEDKPLNTESFRNSLDVIKYGNNKGYLTIVFHPLSKISGGVNKEKLEELINMHDKGNIEFAVELNPFFVENHLPFLFDYPIKETLNLLTKKPKIPIVSGQDSHDSRLLKCCNYINIDTSPEQDPSGFLKEMRESIYNKKHYYDFHSGSFLHLFLWRFVNSFKNGDFRGPINNINKLFSLFK